ncbi:MbtH family protein [Actinosynnema sp. ALI-1.44]|uniref:MbtH family protein n=1 Tax=Actinosynnema sp. ALI-1.44 TaxID=1933779 RepID=UPI00097C43EF|nr:MbtH family protein [Actinosynnema sp. ALI-1.44]ONI76011.1 MbtH family protein [Actinosynnema sp. ALI-1.44]
MRSPFDDENATYVVLVNDEEQQSLWPFGVAVPAGWTNAFGPSSRSDCLAFVEREWTDMRPRTARPVTT